MSESFLGQVMMTGFGFAPRNFASCNGQILPINQNQALFALLGTQFGGNGSTTFALPDLRGRTPVGAGGNGSPGWQPAPWIGESGGLEAVSLGSTQIPPHTHVVGAVSAPGNSRLPSSRRLATNTAASGPIPALYGPANGPRVALAPQSVSGGGSGQAHPNLQPYAVLGFCICLQGIFPSRN